MKILLNHGHPMASLDMLALEVEAAAGALASLEMLVRPIKKPVNGSYVTEEQVDESFRCIHATLRRVATDMHICFEVEQEQEAAAAKRIRHLQNINNPDGEFYITDKEIVEEIERKWGKDWNLRTVDPDDRWVKEYTHRLALRYLEESAGNHRK